MTLSLWRESNLSHMLRLSHVFGWLLFVVPAPYEVSIRAGNDNRRQQGWHSVPETSQLLWTFDL